MTCSPNPPITSPAGPIAPIDILYGNRISLQAGNRYVAHRCGFTAKVLEGTHQSAGFPQVASLMLPAAFDLWAMATCESWDEEAFRVAVSQLISQG